ncbi:hypothetical protein QBZ16_001710 [Prototheca wickerhamii]|uniref:Uncharacterized protein n=1 Tax=Prototheca wickerhamii TaxID=3111 RepID=A0AAD9MGN5_PROWI|nr:hypothetical protein QBZ16_001710 [Prototheca wickerhamii]
MTASLHRLSIGGSLQSTAARLSDAHIWRIVAGEWPRLLRAGLCCVVSVACNLASPVISGRLFQNLVQQQPFDGLWLLAMAVCYTVEPVTSQVYIRAACAAGEAVQGALRRLAFAALLQQRMDFYDRHRASELTALLSRDLDSVRALVFANVSRDRGLRAALEACGSVGVLCALSWRLGPVLAGVILSSAATAFWRRAWPLRARATLETLNRGATHASLLALYGLGGWLAARGLVQPGVLVSAIGFTWSLVFAAQGLLQTNIDLRATLAALRRVQAVVGEQSRDPAFDDGEGDDQSRTTLTDAQAAHLLATGDIVFEDVWFAYPSRPGSPVLRGLSLTIRAGQTTALVGASGAGKSTVAALLLRLYRPDAGRIAVGGVPLERFSRAQWTRGVTSVAQEPRLFARSVRDNIAFGPAAGAGEAARGGQLSGGQRQRIALARALVRDPALLVLDEATSALDAESEARVQGAIAELARAKTLLVVAHRLSTVQAADRIAVLDRGCVAEEGTHAELLRRERGAYARLVEAQAPGRILDA